MADDLYGSRSCHEASIVTDAASNITPLRGAGILRAQAANLLSASRMGLAALWLMAFGSGYRGAMPLGTIAIAGAVSDFLDGRLARRLQMAGGFGRWLDSIADIVFVLTALICEAWANAIAWYIPILIALSFSQYALDSIIFRRLGGGPISSRLGHWGGVINFALVIVLAFAPPPSWPGATVRALSPVLAAVYLAAIGERVIGYVRHPRPHP